MIILGTRRRRSRDATEPRSVRSVLIIEGDGTGHRFMYVQKVADEAVSNGYSTTLLTTRWATRTDEYSHFLANRTRIDCVKAERVNFHTIRAAMAKCQPNIVIAPSGDRLVALLGLVAVTCPAAAFSILVLRDPTLRGPITRPSMMTMKQFAKAAIISLVSRLPNMTVKTLVAAGSNPGHAQVADPASLALDESTVQSLKLELDLDPAWFWFAILGAITERKNVDTVLLAANAIIDAKIGVLLCGKIDAAVRSQIERIRSEHPELKVAVRDGFLDDKELDALVAIVDCLVIAHSNEGPSGLFAKALVSGTRIVASGAESLKRDCARHPESADWVPLRIPALSDAMRAAVMKDPPDQQLESDTSAFARSLIFPELA